MGIVTDVFKIKNLLIGLKAIAVNILYVLIFLIAAALVSYLPELIATIVSIILAVTGLFLWGYIANRLWKWK